MSWIAIKSTSNLFAFPFPLLLDSLLLAVVQNHPRLSPYCVFLKPPYLSSSHLNIPQMTFFFRHLSQSTHVPLRDLFSFWVNTRGYTSITHQSHISVLTPASSALVLTSSLMIGDSPLLVSWGVPNEQIPRSAGTASEGGWTSWLNLDARKIS